MLLSKYLSGASTIFNLFPELDLDETIEKLLVYNKKSISEALRGDWIIIGNDIRKAMRSIPHPLNEES